MYSGTLKLLPRLFGVPFFAAGRVHGPKNNNSRPNVVMYLIADRRFSYVCVGNLQFLCFISSSSSWRRLRVVQDALL